MFGTMYSCKTCDDLQFCFKCYPHRENIHDKTHEFNAVGPTYDESYVAEDPSDSDDSGSENSDSSAVSIGL